MEIPAPDAEPVTANEFVELIHRVAYRQGVAEAVQGLREPPGRKPDADLLAMHEWFTHLDEDDAGMVEEAMRLAGYLVAFGVMGILDGVGGRWRSVDRFTIIAKTDSGQYEIDAGDDFLHDMFGLIGQEESGWDA